jgi:hypothetical protein
LATRPPKEPPVAIPMFLISNATDDRVTGVWAVRLAEQYAKMITSKTGNLFI